MDESMRNAEIVDVDQSGKLATSRRQPARVTALAGWGVRGESECIVMAEIEVRISWTGSGAELLQWVDDDED